MKFVTIPPRFAMKVLAKSNGSLRIRQQYVGRGIVKGHRVGVSQAYYYEPINSHQIEIEVENNTPHPVLIDRDACLGYIEAVDQLASNIEADVAAQIDVDIRKINSSIHADLVHKSHSNRSLKDSGYEGRTHEGQGNKSHDAQKDFRPKR